MYKKVKRKYTKSLGAIRGEICVIYRMWRNIDVDLVHNNRKQEKYEKYTMGLDTMGLDYIQNETDT